MADDSQSEDSEWDLFDSSERAPPSEMEDFVHSVHKVVHYEHWTKLDDGELHVEDEDMGEREAGYHMSGEYDYGEFFSCNCGENFRNKEAARDHLLEANENSQ